MAASSIGSWVTNASGLKPGAPEARGVEGVGSVIAGQLCFT
jgi:hypothetical protein